LFLAKLAKPRKNYAAEGAGCPMKRPDGHNLLNLPTSAQV